MLESQDPDEAGEIAPWKNLLSKRNSDLIRFRCPRLQEHDSLNIFDESWTSLDRIQKSSFRAEEGSNHHSLAWTTYVQHLTRSVTCNSTQCATFHWNILKPFKKPWNRPHPPHGQRTHGKTLLLEDFGPQLPPQTPKPQPSAVQHDSTVRQRIPPPNPSRTLARWKQKERHR